MRTELFDFHLPPELIAQHPARPRDSARLLVVDEGLQDRRVLDLPDLLEPADLLVLNNTRVLPSRLVGSRGESTIEVTLHAHGQGGRWRAFARPARKFRPGDRLTFGPDFTADVLAKGEGGEITLQFACGEGSMIEQLEAHGAMPLPPYIKRLRGGDPRDRDDYQTLFARRAGAVAAPTAALHFIDPWLSPAPHPAADGRRYCSTTRSTCSISMGSICARCSLPSASACCWSCWTGHPNASFTPSTWRQTP